MRGKRTGGLLALVMIGAAVFAAGPVAAAPPSFCDDLLLRAERLPERFSLHNCDVVGTRIVGGGVQMRVPPRGKGLSIRAMTVDGEHGMDVRTTRDGYVEVDIERSADSSALPVAADAQPPANDLYAQAETVAPSNPFDWSVPGTTQGATAAETADDQANEVCQIAPEEAPGHTVWFAFTAQRDEQQVDVEAVTADLGVSARADVFTSWDGTSLDYAACDGDGLWGVWNDQTYLIRVATDAPSDFALRWHPPRPEGDHFSAANVISQPFFYDNYMTEAMLGATCNPGNPCRGARPRRRPERCGTG